MNRFLLLCTVLLALAGYGDGALAQSADTAPAPDAATAATAAPTVDPHAAVFANNPFPSARECGACHTKVFWEWSVSNHAYASISPMFHKFEQTISTLSSGTIGTFCVRCHQQIGTQLGEPRERPLWQRSEVSREGITCVTCHRVNKEFNKVNGEREVLPGSINDPVYGAGRGTHYGEVVADSQRYDVALSPGQEGRPIHSAPIRFETISRSEFCVSCHQVAVHPGIKLEVVWDQYRDSPAFAKGVTCQDCHMGKVPGRSLGYETWPIAIVNGQVVGSDSQKHSNHMFFGPGYPIAHPGLFPFNPKALHWSIEQWLQFDYRSDWGKAEWEDAVAQGRIAAPDFPAPWTERAQREAARSIIDDNSKLLEAKRRSRIAVLENGSRLDGPIFDTVARSGHALRFHYNVVNIDPGHNLPSGSLGAQPEIWLDVVLVGPDGRRVFESGYVDSNGDMADLHSLDYAKGKIALDDQLFNLQTKFLTTNVVGTDREMYLPVNFDVDQLPFIRPSGVPTTVLNHPPLIRMEQRSIPPLGQREARYTVPAELMKQAGKYVLQVRLRSRAEPIYFMRFCGATPEMERSMNQWMIDIHPQATEFEVE
ncbi:multiheme c-type cytochrome [Solimonas terrae]|uniref:Cytochrome C n=1 Tax=Solimonas terrae TaxID=1396819 RepID=A0A6M2BVN0_9GAMM|nr:multiheme c-type cytochrome [Solimonas terrae]NGY06049.1 cytochrome C [Solimonas terrae]